MKRMKFHILRLYKDFYNGRENAITRARFKAEHGWKFPKTSDRDFRRIYSQLPICTCKKGGFYPIRTSEIEEFRDYMRKKAIPLFNRFNLVRAAHPDLAGEIKQLELFAR